MALLFYLVALIEPNHVCRTPHKPLTSVASQPANLSKKKSSEIANGEVSAYVSFHPSDEHSSVFVDTINVSI